MAQKSQGVIVTKSGEFAYEYHRDYHSNLKADVYFFKIWKTGDDLNTIRPYSFCLRVMENGKDLKVVDMFACDYKGKGISIPILFEAKRIFGKKIISSSNQLPTYSGESNWQNAIDKIWKPLLQQGFANYDAKYDHYYLQ